MPKEPYDDTVLSPSATRRAWLDVAALLASCQSYLVAGADSGTAESSRTDGGRDAEANGDATQDSQVPIDPADGPRLNALLSAEYATIAAYAAGAGVLAAPAPDDPLAPLAPMLLQIAGRWLGHHQQHARSLEQAVAAAGVTPVDASSVRFSPPTGFTPSVPNVLKLAANAEKALALAHNRAVGTLLSAGHRFLAASIQGSEVQHFIVLYVILRGTAQPGSQFASGLAQIVPVAFASGTASEDGLERVPDLSYG